MNPLQLYLRREPTTDDVAKQYLPSCVVARKRDVVAYRDKACTQPIARWPWHYKSKPRSTQRVVTVNCHHWGAVWL